MTMRRAMFFGALLFVFCGLQAKAQIIPDRWQLPPAYVPSGEVMYKQYCAACHGAGGKGDGPAVGSLKALPPDLTTLAKRHDAKFPYEYVSTVLLFGPGTTSHGSPTMPTWGPIFGILDKQNAHAVQQRIKNLTDYLASIQEK